MLLILTELRQSTIHGLGVFALRPVEQGAPVLKHNPIIDIRIPAEQITGSPEVVKAFFSKYGTIWDNEIYFSLDDSRFMNHSFDPNIKIAWDADDNWYYYAVRAIEAGDELTCDYRDIDQNFDSYAQELK